jgi:5,5'-dehydrodivanillate O-demethylase
MIEGDTVQSPEEIPYYNPPVPMLDENEQPVFPILRSNSGQDTAAWITQGPIADRTGEHLGRSDKGIIQFRQMLEDNIRLVEEGKDPMCTFRDPEKNQYVPFMTEQAQYAATSIRQGAATMYSPVLNARAAAGTL